MFTFIYYLDHIRLQAPSWAQMSSGKTEVLFSALSDPEVSFNSLH